MSFIDEKEIAAAMSVKLDFDVPPEKATFQEGIRRAPDRGFRLTQAQTEIAPKTLCVTFLKIPPRVDPRISGRTENARSDLWLSLPSKRSHLWKTN